MDPRQDKMRRAELAKIHIAKKDLGLDDDTYRLMLHEVAGVESAGDLNTRGRRAVLEHLKELGFAAKTKGRPGNIERSPGAGPQRTSRARQLEKIEALLTVGSKPWAYADALAARICRTRDGAPIEKIAWVPTGELYKVITALRKQAQREGWDLSGEIS